MNDLAYIARALQATKEIHTLSQSASDACTGKIEALSAEAYLNLVAFLGDTKPLKRWEKAHMGAHDD